MRAGRFVSVCASVVPLVLAAFAAHAAQATTVCMARAKGPDGAGMILSRVRGDAGEARLRIAAWSPPGAHASTPLFLSIIYPVQQGALGAPSGVVVGYAVEAPGGGSADRGEFSISLEGKTWRAPWSPGLRTPLGASAVMAATAANGAQLHPDLLTAIARAKTVEVLLSSPTGAPLVKRTFDISDVHGREALFRQAMNAETCRVAPSMLPQTAIHSGAPPALPLPPPRPN